jgi:hypothetical protein
VIRQRPASADLGHDRRRGQHDRGDQERGANARQTGCGPTGVEVTAPKSTGDSNQA